MKRADTGKGMEKRKHANVVHANVVR